MSVKFTSFKFIFPEFFDTSFAKSTTFCFARSQVYGGAWKNEASIFTPRFAIIYPATGLSIPPDNSSMAFPLVPTGSPPAPFMVLE